MPGRSRGDNAAGIAAALKRYARLRRARVGRVQRTARRNGTIYHLNGPAALARDWFIRAIGPATHAGAAGLDLRLAGVKCGGVRSRTPRSCGHLSHP